MEARRGAKQYDDKWGITNYKRGYKRGAKYHINPDLIVDKWKHPITYILGFDHGYAKAKEIKMKNLITGEKHYPKIPNSKEAYNTLIQHNLIK